MKKTIIKILSVVLVVVITLTSAPLSGFVGLELPEWLDFSIISSAATTSGTCGDNLTWTFDYSTGTLTILGTGEMRNYSSSISLWSSLSAKEVVINNGVTTIGTYAFKGCNTITSVTIPDTVILIGKGAFSDCTALESISIPNSVTTIDAAAFYYCTNLSSVVIGHNVTSIGLNAFAFCENLECVDIPDSVTTIGECAFYDCYSLTEITVDANNEYYSSDEDGVLYNKDKTTLIQYPIGNSRMNYTTYDGVTTIGDFAFFNCCNLKNMTISNGVMTIGEHAFRYCDNLASVTVPGSVTTIGFHAFNGCTRLTDVYYLSSEEQWKKILIDSYNSELLNATIHFNSSGGNTETSNACGNNLTWSLDDKGVLTISGTGDMYNWPDSLSAPWVDYRNAITSIVIEEGATSIGDYAFNYCMNCASVSIPDTVTSIGNYAFDTCASLTSITIPVSVTSIGDYAFYNCIKVTDVYYLGTEKQWSRIEIGVGNVFTTATMHFADDENKTYYIVGREFDKNIDYYTTYWNSSKYNVKLANMLAALSVAAYDENKIKSAYESLGFDFDINNDLYDYDGEFDTSRCGYSLKFKESECNDDMICLISVRGSSNTSDWHSNFYITTFDEENHFGFYNPALNIYNNIQSILKSKNIKKDVKYVITGHSRGAAVANLLSVILMDEGVSSSNVYNYNFACPDVACKSYFPNYYNIFNLCNRADVVPHCPSNYANSVTNATSGANWDKYGQTYWFTKEAESSFAAHNKSLYLEYFDKQLYPEEWEGNYLDKYNNDNKLFYGIRLLIFCPVDVIVTDRKGNKIASVISGEINYYDSIFGDVVIITDGDRKVIYINGENDFNVELIGTDTGTMTYSVERCNIASGEIYESKTFNDVTLEDGKTMYSPVSEAETTEDVQLFTTEEKDGERVYTNIINEDGTEEKYYNYTFSIQNPSRTEIRNKDGIILHANVDGTAPNGFYIKWESSNGNFDKSADGSNLKIIAKNKGWTTFTAILCDADGNELARDSVEMYSKSGFFDKIGGFFRSLFGTTKIYEN